MKVSVDISMYPLKEEYCQPIIDFIEAMEKAEKVSIQRNSMSTHIYGEFADVMSAMNSEIEKVLNEIPQTVFVIKLIGTDREKANIRAC
ncbi:MULTISPECIES: YkoF family thiamine/hydroxymethylpyrimidine-binding protein [Thiomicrorhabdus]|uniref:Thiamine-binding protein n=1 Tax=Thiomicrorhabdus heinhorstiae TaxID=2748010 RepID=A0ABS0BUA6_9GAMM|nr:MULTISPECIES: YkoF family thiamine/hydroxymethylpyrimidine-binding protein [Thiomicrorhabdus]MBF6057355.1 thiamine-binding protein [Thiomicrorhabdus heinhorstiae]